MAGSHIYVIADDYAAALETLQETTGAWARNNRNQREAEEHPPEVDDDPDEAEG